MSAFHRTVLLGASIVTALTLFQSPIAAARDIRELGKGAKRLAPVHLRADERDMSASMFPLYAGNQGHDFVIVDTEGNTSGTGLKGDVKYASTEPGIGLELKSQSTFSDDVTDSFSIMLGLLSSTGSQQVTTGTILIPTRIEAGNQVSGVDLDTAGERAHSKLSAEIFLGEYAITKHFPLVQNHFFSFSGGVKAGYVHHDMFTRYFESGGVETSLLGTQVKQENTLYGAGPYVGARWSTMEQGWHFTMGAGATIFLANHTVFIERPEVSLTGTHSWQDQLSTDTSVLNMFPLIEMDASVKRKFVLQRMPMNIEFGYRLQDWMGMVYDRRRVENDNGALTSESRNDFLLHGPFLRVTMAL